MAWPLTYDPHQVQVTVTVGDTVNTITGMAEGTFVTCGKDTDDWTDVVGAHGEVTKMESSDKSGRITVVLKSSSPSNKLFRTLANGRTIFSIEVEDQNTDYGFVCGGTKASIERLPEHSRGTGLENTTWMFRVADWTLKNKD